MPRVFIIHMWTATPEDNWYEWLKQELEKKGFTASILEMPDTDHPKIDAWVSTLSAAVGTPDKDTYFVGHSVGVQAILRYLASLSEAVEVGGAVFVAGWFKLTEASYESEEDRQVAEPWLSTPIDFTSVLRHANRFVAIFSDNDPYVPLDDADIFKEKLGAEIVVAKEQGHFDMSEDVTELPEALDAVLSISGEKTT